MTDVQKVERRGGFRPGAGRKPDKQHTLATYQVAKMLRKAKKLAKLRGKDIDDILLEIIYSAQDKPRDVIAAIKIFKDLTMPKISEGGDTDKTLGPAVFLPEHRPSLTVVKNDKVA
jgi:hypothetical protein